MKKIWLMAAFAALVLCSCDPDGSGNEDKTKEVDKDGSVEVTVSVKHLANQRDVVCIERKFYAGGIERRTVQSLDTVPSLGMTNDKAQDDNGNDTTVTVPKNYQIFITVK
ncbi:MAG: hypothetical protein JWM20_997 [Patescibacteria group bacterium]|nr:hypothetical protein [Patescibacteria group bacterium]